MDTTPKQEWTTLEKQFNKNSNLARLRLKTQYYNMRMHEGDSADASQSRGHLLRKRISATY